MLQKSLSSKTFFLSAVLILFALLGFSFSAIAQDSESSISDVRFFLQFLNAGCTEAGDVRASYSVQSGLPHGVLVKSPSPNPDCVKIGLQRDPPSEEVNYSSTFSLDTDFRICGQGVDNINGNSYNQVGPLNCTPWASQVVGTEGKAKIHDADKTDPDGAILFIETRALPENTSIENIRVGVSASDNQCSDQQGSVQWTGWAQSLASGDYSFSAIATDADGVNFDCFNIHLASASSNICRDSAGSPPQRNPHTGPGPDACISEGWLANDGYSDEELNEIGAALCLKNLGSGDRVCPNSDGFITSVVALNSGSNPDRYLQGAGCQVIKNIAPESFVPTYAPNKPKEMIADATCNTRGCTGVYTCPENYAVKGIDYFNPDGVHDDYSRRLICLSLRDGVTIDHDREIFLPNNGCGGFWCASSANTKVGDGDDQYVWRNPNFRDGDAWVATGAIYNNGRSGRHVKGVLYAPIQENENFEVRACNPGEEPGLPPLEEDDSSESDSNDGEEIQISCSFTANPASLAKDSAGNVIGASTLAWECKEDVSGNPASNLVNITEDHETQDFSGLGNNLNAQGSVDVSPTQTTRFILEYPGFPPSMVTVEVTESSLQEDIP